MASWDDVVAAGRALPEVEESTSYGTPALKVRGKLLCRLRTDPDALAIRVLDLGDKEALLQQDPAVFFTTPHYDGYPYVLVRLEAIDGALLGELVEDAWRTRAPKRLVAAFDADRRPRASLDGCPSPSSTPTRRSRPCVRASSRR